MRQLNRRLRLALIRAEAASPASAAHIYHRLLRRQPRIGEAWLALGAQAQAQGRQPAARRAYRRALRTSRQAWEPWYRLGMLAQAEGQFVEAIRGLQASHRLKPDFAPAATALAELLVALEQPQAAIPLFLDALEHDPGNDRLYLGLADVLSERGDFDLVLDCLKSLCLVHPHLLGVVSFYLGYLLEKQGDFASAMLCYDKALAEAPLLTWGLKRDLAFPLLMDSRAQIDACAQRLNQVLDEYLLRLRLHKPQERQLLGFHVFDALLFNLTHIAYHHYSPLELRRKMAQAMRMLLPQPELAPAPLPKPAGEPIHLGVIVSAQLNVALIYIRGLLESLDPEGFRITLFSPSALARLVLRPEHPLQLSHPRLEVCLLASDAIAAARQIRAAGLDAFWLTEPCWDGLQYRLSLQRLAPVQFTSCTNPGTTGADTVDYYLSTRLCEGPQAQRFYAEKLWRLDTMPGFSAPIALPPQTMTAADFGLPEEGRLYLCPHNLLKFHPDFDALLEGVLRADPEAQIVLTTFKGQDRLAEQLVARFQRRMPELTARIWVLPYLDRVTFFNLLRLGQVLLEPLYYGGGTICFQALACGLPMITLPLDWVLSRINLGLYRSMSTEPGDVTPGEQELIDIDLGELAACVANSPEDYVAKAVRLANDSALRQRVSARIRERLPRLFDDPAACRAFADFLTQVCRPAALPVGR